MTSVGAELIVDASLQYDFLYRFRLGVAKPFRGSGVSGGASPEVYFTLGSSF
jgi:hypothetical protein